jgi:mannose-6-phosphate isomerase-like protein (cupin superfamily)
MTTVNSPDDTVNMPVEDVEFEVDSSADYQRLRQRWTALPSVPKLVDAATAPVILSGGGQTIRLLLRGEESAGSLMVAHVSLEPGGNAVPDHHQPFEDELWFAIEGEWEWKIGTETRRVGPGGFAYAPRNTTHAFANVGQSVAIMLTINTPAGHERGFIGLSKLLGEGASEDTIARHFANHDFVFHQALPGV